MRSVHAMGNPRRQDHDGAFHHIFNRGARKDLIFFDDNDRRRWIAILIDVCAKRGVEIHAYCLMGNHFHLIVRSRGAIHDVIRDVCSRYVKGFNLRHGLDGPLHRSPYRNVIIESDEHFMTLSRYVHRNPVDIHRGPLERYRWSSYRHFLNPDSAPPWLCVDRTLALFRDDPERYHRFVSGDVVAAARRVPDDGLFFETTVSVHDIVDAVAAAADVDPLTLRAGRVGIRSPGRLAVCLLAEEFGVAVEATVRALGYASRSSVRTGVRRGRSVLADNPAFARLLDAARQSLSERDQTTAAAA